MSHLAVSQKPAVVVPVQELSIQWLSLARIQKYTNISKEEREKTPLGKLVDRIIQVYNKIKSKDGGKAGQFEDLDEYNFESSHNYDLRVYRRFGKFDTVLARHLKDGGVSEKKLPKKTSTEFILFFFRTIPRHEIVALTTGSACESIRPCVNYGVPIIIAGRILDPCRISEITRRCLLGNDIKETVHNPSGRELSKTSNIYYLIDSFKCRVKIDCSLMGFPFLSSAAPEVTIRTGLLRIMKRITLENYPPLLALLSEHIHAHRRPAEALTYNNLGEVEVSDREFEFLHFLQAVPSLRNKLDRQAVLQIFQTYQAGRRQEFSIRHKYLQEFLDAAAYELQYASGSRFQALSSRPESMEEIVGLLFRNNEDSVSSAEAMHTAFTTANLRYQRKDGTKAADHLIEYVEGEVRDENGNAYFKIRNMWFKLAVDFQGLLHDDFRGLLRQTVIRQEDEGHLPKPWRGNKVQGQVSQVAIGKKFKISKGIRKFMGTLKEARVCFAEKNGNVKQKVLVGEILKVEVIRKHRDAIDKEVLSKKKLPSEEQMQELFEDDAADIIKELQKKRSVLTEAKKGEPVYVANPFPYPLRSNSLVTKNYETFAAYFEELHQVYVKGVEDEEAYNRAYIAPPYGFEKGYLVFDQICPNNIEPCDIVYFTDETVYLYHVKETLGQHTRDACSQVLNAAKELRSALSTQHEDNYIQLLWKKATGQLKDKKSKKPSDWETRVKKQMELIGEEAFYSIFKDRRVVFVYAFLDHSRRSIHEEARVKSCLSAADLGLSKKLQVHQKLKDLQFLDRSGRLTGKFCASSKERFTKADASFTDELYEQMRHYQPGSASTLAKIELLDTAREVRALGFDFKICQIQRPGGAYIDNSLPPDPPPSDESDDDSDAASSTSDASSDAPEVSDDEPEAGPTVILNGPVGLYNVGNSCYINGILQALFNIPEVRELIAALGDDASDSMLMLKQILKQILQSEGPPTRETLRQFRKHVFAEAGDAFPGGLTAQQDAHELLTFVLDQLNWKPIRLFNRYEVDEVFHDSQREDPPTHHLSVSIDEEESFQGALDNYFAPEEMKAGGKIEPLRLDQLDDSASEWEQTICIKNPLPGHLIVHLKRFKSDRSKITSALSLPKDGIVTIADETGAVTEYEIIAFVNHHGRSSKGGHYTADLKNSQDPPGSERWVHCNDDKLAEMAPINPGTNAYIVFLKKVDA